MKLSPDKQSICVNESLTLAAIPPEAFDYRLGSRSALDWIIDQYQVKGESDPNREDDPGYIRRLIGQVVRVSVETVRIQDALPACRGSVHRSTANIARLHWSEYRSETSPAAHG
jgi:predicted helicase